MKEIISSLDIGSSTIKLVVGEYYKDEANVLALSEVKSKGIKKGNIVNPEEALIFIREAFERCEEILNIKIDKVLLVVPSYFASFIVTEGVCTITNEEGVVTPKDIVRCMQACVYNQIPNNRELVSICPIEYTLDDDKIVLDPKNMRTTKLKCKAMISLVPKKNVYTAFSLLDSLGVSVIDINYGSACDYNEFKEKNMDKECGAIINIGDNKTEVSVINKGILVETENLEVGGRNIDRDICYVYDIHRKVAVLLKEKFALASKRNSSTSEYEEVLTKGEENIKINQYEISEIVYSRIKEILELSKKQINVLTKKEISYIIITGGTTDINDFDLVVEEVFGKELKNYKVKEMGCRSNKYSSVLGLIKYYRNKLVYREKLAFTVDEDKQAEIVNTKKTNNSTVLGKIYGYFFNN